MPYRPGKWTMKDDETIIRSAHRLSGFPGQAHRLSMKSWTIRPKLGRKQKGEPRNPLISRLSVEQSPKIAILGNRSVFANCNIETYREHLY